MSKRYMVCKEIAWLLVIGVMITIYSLSSQPAAQSTELSDQFIEGFRQAVETVPVLTRGIKASVTARASFYVRKLAHAWIYALLGSVTLIALWQSTIKRCRCIWLSLLISTLYAMTDEWHQLYVMGRSGELRDVMIDSIGALIGILLTYCLLVIISQIRLWGKE